jgi:6-phosphogluconolactonase
VVPNRQDLPHVHSINTDNSNRFVYVCDFSADEITTYAFDSGTAELKLHSTVATAPGAGPRHMAVHPDLPLLYVINELGGTVSVFRTEEGRLTHLQSITTLPEDFAGHNTSAEILISPDRRFVYGTNRGHESVAQFRIDPESGLLSFVSRTPTGGEHPRNLAIDTSGRFMIASNRNTDNLVVFRIDQATGTPVPTGQQIELSVPMAVQVVDLG